MLMFVGPQCDVEGSDNVVADIIEKVLLEADQLECVSISIPAMDCSKYTNVIMKTVLGTLQTETILHLKVVRIVADDVSSFINFVVKNFDISNSLPLS